MPDRTRSPLEGYIIAALAVAFAILLRFPLQGILGDTTPFLFFFPAIVFSGWRGGLGPGLAATLLSGFFAPYLFVEPLFSFTHSTRDLINVGLFLVAGTFISLINEARRRSRRREEETKDSERRQRDLWQITLSSIGDAVIATDAQGRITFMNPIAQSLTGWKIEEAKGKPLPQVFEIVNEMTHEKVEDPVAKVFRLNSVVGLANHTILLARDGREIPIDDSGAPIRDKKGNIVGVVLVFRDISERKGAEQSKAILTAIVESSDSAIIGKKLDGTIVSWNRGAERLYGYTHGEAVGQPISILIPSDMPDELPQIMERLKRGEVIATYETVRCTKDGRRIDVVLTISPINDSEGNIIGASAIARDITERKRAEASLKESEERFRIMADSAPIMIWMSGADKLCTYFNKGWLDFTGRTIEQELGNGWAEGVYPDDYQHCLSTYTTAFDARQEFEMEYRLRRFDGQYCWITGKAVPRYALNGEFVGYIGTCVDITDRKRADEERDNLLRDLQEANALLDTLFTNAPIGIGVWDKDLRYIRVNDALVEMNGLPREAHIGKTVEELLPGLADEVMKSFRQVIESGESVPSQLVSGETPAAPGKKRSWTVSYYPINLQGEFAGLGAICQEITDKLQYEKEREQLLAREQVAREEAEAASRAKDEFLATISHELRTPLNAILGWIGMLRSGRLDDATKARALETLDRNARSQAQLIEDMLEVSRIVTGKLRLDVQPVELTSVIQLAVDTVRPTADAKGVRLQIMLDPNAGPVSGDPNRLQQVVWNLLSNAVKFTPKDGRVQIRLERINSHVQLAVSDTGQGISSEFLPYVFERFRQADSSLSRKYGGLGLGLAIVRHLVELHGGSVEAMSDGEGQGSTFLVKIPVIIVHGRQAIKSRSGFGTTLSGRHMSPESLPSLIGLRLLVVEDEADARELALMMLKECGAEVKAVATVAEGLDTLKDWKPDVLVSDIEMPIEDGYSFIRKVRSFDAESIKHIPAIALTAHVRGEDRIKALSEGFDAHVAKPVDLTELATVIISLARRSKG